MHAPIFLTALPRKRVRHFDFPGDAHFLTFSCFRRLPLLSKDRTRKWLVESIADAREKHQFDLWAWVIMPEHVHMLIYPRRTQYAISSVLADIKRPVAQRAIAYLVSRKSSFLRRLTVQHKNRTHRRFWQAGPGQDHNIYEPKTAHRVVEYIHNKPSMSRTGGTRGGLVLVKCPRLEWSIGRADLRRSDAYGGCQNSFELTA